MFSKPAKRRQNQPYSAPALESLEPRVLLSGSSADAAAELYSDPAVDIVSECGAANENATKNVSADIQAELAKAIEHLRQRISQSRVSGNKPTLIFYFTPNGAPQPKIPPQ
jgi:hypothetical protein